MAGRRQALIVLGVALLAIVAGYTAWSLNNYLDSEHEPPLQGLSPSTTTLVTPPPPLDEATELDEQAINLDEFRECIGTEEWFKPSSSLPAWAHFARPIAGRWIVMPGAVALPSIDPERPLLSILWHLENPPAEPYDFTVEGTTASGERLDPPKIAATAPGFFQSTFPLEEEACWTVRAEWGPTEVTMNILIPGLIASSH